MLELRHEQGRADVVAQTALRAWAKTLQLIPQVGRNCNLKLESCAVTGRQCFVLVSSADQVGPPQATSVIHGE